jgi:hypothetical protein
MVKKDELLRVTKEHGRRFWTKESRRKGYRREARMVERRTLSKNSRV